LVQNDKGGGLAGAFGGMGGGAAFTGSSTVTILTKVTQWLGAVAFVVLLLLNYQGMKSNRVAQNESELKDARKGLSTALPPASGAPAIPGLGGGDESAPAIPGLGGAPEGGTSGSGQ
jgi:preprotein translocase subunit SecG